MRRQFHIVIFVAALTLFAPAGPVGAAGAAGISTSVVSIGGQNYYVHTVEAGQTIYSLSKLYGVSQTAITDNNPQTVEGLQVGQVIKIPQVRDEKPLTRRKQERLFEQHTVNQGETAYSICKRYGITIQTLVEDNPGIDPVMLGIGQTLMIRRESMNTPQAAIDTTWKQYNVALNSVSTDYVYHNVEKGETLYSLTRRYGVSEEAIRRSNDISDGLKAGQMLRIPVSGGGVGTGAGASTNGGVADGPSSLVAPRGSINVITPVITEIGADGAPIVPALPAVDSVRRHWDSKHLNIALLLPLKSATETPGTFMDFYKGSLVALQDLKNKGISVNVQVCNDTRTADGVRGCLERPQMKDVELIIGPVYESEMGPALDFARAKGIPVVSPLAADVTPQSNLIYQMSPTTATKYDKLREVLQGGDRNVIVVRSASADTEFASGITPMLPAQYATVDYSPKMPSSTFEKYLTGARENVVVVLAQEEIEIDEILARLSSLQTNLVARGIGDPQITVVGASRWQRFAAVDRNLFFKLRLNFVSLYYADRSDRRVAEFDRRYIAAFGTLPSPYSYRGCDAVKLFVSGVLQGGGDPAVAVNAPNVELLQMPYRFVQPLPNATHVNDAWALVQYHDDYTITVN